MPKETLKSKKQRIKKAVALLKRYRPKADCALYHKNPVQLMVATVLSAQCTDKRVNQVTKTLFKKYPTAKAFSQAKLKELEKEIYSTGFFRSKAEKIKTACGKIQKEFKGTVPNRLEDLLTLPGVGRKTAHVILGTAFQISSGVVVDTHVRRLSNRLNFTNSEDPEKIEKDLCELLPRTDWIYFSHALILHGREVCKARVPRCKTCFLEELCPKKGVV
jgi:endonuclease-3